MSRLERAGKLDELIKVLVLVSPFFFWGTSMVVMKVLHTCDTEGCATYKLTCPCVLRRSYRLTLPHFLSVQSGWCRPALR